MKISSLAAAVLGAVVLIGCKPKAAAPPPVTGENVLGTWSGTDSVGTAGTLVLDANGSADIIKAGTSMRQMMVQEFGTLTYRLDPAAKPAELDIIVTKADGHALTLHGIVEFLTRDSMKWRLVTKGPPPKDFSGPADETIVLHREAGQ